MNHILMAVASFGVGAIITAVVLALWIRPREERWSPDPEVLRKLEEEIVKQKSTCRIAVGGQILTWQNLLDEIKTGTPLGRRYYKACLKSSLVSKK